MSEHRRKPPQPNGGGRAAGRRGAQPPSPSPAGGRPTPPRSGPGPYGGRDPSGTGGPSGPGDTNGTGGAYRGAPARHHDSEPERPYGGRAEARRAAQRGGRRRAAGGPDGPGAGGGRRGGGGPGGGGRGPNGPNGPHGPNGPKPKRLIDYPRWGKHGWRRWTPSWRQSMGITVAFCGTLVALIGVAYLTVGVPSENAAAATQKNVYYWADGTPMVVSGGGDLNRQIVDIQDIPKPMQNAVVSAENATFWTDSGIDPQGVARAIVKMAEGGETQSGSTITQQYVKNTYLDQSQTVTRKFKEMLISIKVGEQMPKSKILAGYLNTGYYGRGAYGIQAASQAYYGIDCDKLSVSQSAFMGALLNGPNLYDPNGGIGPGATPSENLTRAKARWSWILDREVDTHDLTPSQRAQYKTFPMPKPPKPATNKAGQIGYLTDLADNYVEASSPVTARDLAQGGYQIYTTFNKKDVMAMQKAVTDVTKASFNTKLRPKTDTYVQFGGASVVPGDGAIRAIYGGVDYLKHFTDNADYTGAQVGSTFKPFVLAAAMQYGVRDPNGPTEQPLSERTIVSPKSEYPGKNNWKVLQYNGQVWTDKDGKEWLQANDESDNFPSNTLEHAMQESVNSTYVQLGMDVGTDMVQKSALAAGVNKDSLASDQYPSFSIGTSSPSAIRMADAYSTFASNGEHYEPYSVTKVEQKGVAIYQHHSTSTQAYSSAVAQNVTGVLQDVVQHGTGTYALNLGRPAAGKTGTTDSNKSAWFTGYTPQLATSIGMFRMNDQAKPPTFLPMYGLGGNAKIFGASYPTEIWTAYMKQALAGQPVKQFPPVPKLGTAVNAHGASSSPSPSATPSPSASASTSPSPSISPSVSGTPLPGPSDSCGFFGCQPGGGTGGGNGGTGGGGMPSTTPSTGPGTGGGNNGGGNNGGGANGGLFGGNTG
ncbi:transglycosylase domain-containing protein [Streptomyces sp. SL13]|uniref:Transglycosylase domain-containing protein n=1 Tax=Streptantibioticus silvisoli TaxID=2705255 RepID=A0AA90GZM2_9ACTN|nr:transglycosylase domain-containing protein [Streptantibioticus silvisoli]MDI5970539.1 transglycosylase domain-containing protein [Streptantibioticus silvisoli]